MLSASYHNPTIIIQQVFARNSSVNNKYAYKLIYYRYIGMFLAFLIQLLTLVLYRDLECQITSPVTPVSGIVFIKDNSGDLGYYFLIKTGWLKNKRSKHTTFNDLGNIR